MKKIATICLLSISLTTLAKSKESEAVPSLSKLQCSVIAIGRLSERKVLLLTAQQGGITLESESDNELSFLQLTLDNKEGNFGANLVASRTESGILLSGNIIDGKNSLIAYGHGILFSDNQFSSNVTELRNSNNTVEIFQLNCKLKTD